MILQVMNKEMKIKHRIVIESVEHGLKAAFTLSNAVILSGDPRTERDVECLAMYRNKKWSIA